VTATDIVFTGESSGLFDARDARTGRLLWQANTFGGADAAPAIYAAGGHEYIAVNAGGNAIVDRPRTGALDVYALR
jgi:glucose dehydrogenase